jgi:type II secretory ATPase GspE/PulE/Tfp pilus assembly ATPase PilB-like protein
MGLDPFNFADALLGVLAQRLARSLCASCREPHPGTIEEWERFARNYGLDAFANLHPYGPSFRVWRAPGCPACRGTGYRGRIALHELLVCDDDLRQTITHRRPAAEIRTAAVKNGMTTLLQDGIEKALAGLTDLTQVLAAASR